MNNIKEIFDERIKQLEHKLEYIKSKYDDYRYSDEISKLESRLDEISFIEYTIKNNCEYDGCLEDEHEINEELYSKEEVNRLISMCINAILILDSNERKSNKYVFLDFAFMDYLVYLATKYDYDFYNCLLSKEILEKESIEFLNYLKTQEAKDLYRERMIKVNGK